MDKSLKAIVKDLSLRYYLPDEVIWAIVESQFMCAKEAIKSATPDQQETFKNIQFMHLGKLVVKPKRLMHLKAAHERNLKKRNEASNIQEGLAGTDQTS